MGEQAWMVFSTEELARRVDGNDPRFIEFLRTAALSCAVYRLPAGAKDMQSPHLEDEVYFVLAGRAKLKVGGELHEVKPGSLLYVRATTEHSFFEIEEALTLIAIFGPSRPLQV